MWGPVMLESPLTINTNHLTLGTLMKEAGYSTACIGKWHLGFGNEKRPDWNKALKPGPLELGFDYFFGVPVVNSHPPFVYMENHHVIGLVADDPITYGLTAETKAYSEKFGTDWIGGGKAAHALYKDEAVGTTLIKKSTQWIREKKDQPFFLYLATTAIHHPFTPAPQFQGTSDCGPYGDFIHELDWMVGEILAVLDETETADNTLLIFTSDNGGMFNQGGQAAWKAGHRMNSDLLGFKFDAWEGGHRIPFIARWPGNIAAGSTSDRLICNVDMLASLAALTERPLEKGEGPDSLNILPELTGTPGSPCRTDLVLCPRSQSHIALRKNQWLYISASGNGGFTGSTIGEHMLGGPAAHLLTHQVNSDIENGKIKESAPPAQLYNLKKDPSQQQNIYHEHPEVIKEMDALLTKYLQSSQTAPLR